MLNLPQEDAAMAEPQVESIASSHPSRSMNIYLVLAYSDSGENLDWHVVAESAEHARKLWHKYLKKDLGADMKWIHGTKIVHRDVAGPPRILPWEEE